MSHAISVDLLPATGIFSIFNFSFSKIHSFDDIYKLYLVTVYSSVIQNVISRISLRGINPRSRSNTVTFVDGVK